MRTTLRSCTRTSLKAGSRGLSQLGDLDATEVLNIVISMSGSASWIISVTIPIVAATS
jgi:hypothetical protein